MNIIYHLRFNIETTAHTSRLRTLPELIRSGGLSVTVARMPVIMRSPTKEDVSHKVMPLAEG